MKMLSLMVRWLHDFLSLFSSRYFFISPSLFSAGCVPFNFLVEELKVSRQPGITPFFQVMFLEQFGEPRIQLEETVGTNLGIADENQFDLEMHLNTQHASEGRIHGELRYLTALFDRATIESMVSRWLLLLDRLFVQGTASDSLTLVEISVSFF